MSVLDAPRRPAAPSSDPEAPPAIVQTPDGLSYLHLDGVHDAVLLVDPGGHVRLANAAAGRLFGRPVDDLIDEPLQALFATPVDDVLRASHLTVVTAGHRARRVAARHADGHEIAATIEARRSGAAPERGAVVTVRDVSIEARLEAVLDERRDLAEQLQRSQKIGALGRLAGGVAHDFNNLLQVIGGLAESLGAERVPRRARRRMARHVLRTTARAASLTRQLLAFGRRQVLVPEVLDLNRTVHSLERMLTRVIGEDVTLTATLDPALRPVLADPGQIEQVVLNLALNARDAMRDGGALEISTANFAPRVPWEHRALPVRVPPGHWVRLSVRDSGCGMDDATAAQAYEPFFTTKDAASGSGLGLSMVYGIVKQSGGYTWIESAPAAGTHVHVLLPAAAAPVAAERPRVAALAPITPVAGAALLLAEDDADVRHLFTTFLRRAGYVVHEAADGRQALAHFDACGDAIDAIVTDVVMPGISGPALASAARARRPDLKVLYVSGFTEQLELGLQTDAATALLHKPVTRAALLAEIAALLRPAP